MNKLINFLLLMLLASTSMAQQKPPYDRTTTNQVMADRSTWSRYHMAIPKGATPGFPSYVPDSLKCGSLFYRTTDTSLYAYNCVTSKWDKLQKVAVSNKKLDSLAATKANLSGGNTLTGDQTVHGNIILPDYDKGVHFANGSIINGADGLIIQVDEKDGWKGSYYGASMFVMALPGHGANIPYFKYFGNMAWTPTGTSKYYPDSYKRLSVQVFDDSNPGNYGLSDTIPFSKIPELAGIYNPAQQDSALSTKSNLIGGNTFTDDQIIDTGSVQIYNATDATAFLANNGSNYFEASPKSVAISAGSTGTRLQSDYLHFHAGDGQTFLRSNLTGSSNNNIYLPDANGEIALTGSGGSVYTKTQSDSAYLKKADTSNIIDYFVVAGQSQAQGSSGNPAAAPFIPFANVAFQFWNGAVSAGGEPWGNSNGSAWNAFVIRYYQLTGHKVCLVPTALSGTALVPAANPSLDSWDPTGGGTLFLKSIARADSAKNALIALGYKPQFKGVLWSQGEADGSYSLITKSAYTSALSRLIAAYRSHFGIASWFYIFRTGEYGSGYTPYKPVRLWQEQVADTAYNTKIVFRNAVSFYSRGLMRPDSTHYTQEAYNEMGSIGAVEAVSKQKSQLHSEYNSASVNSFYSSGANIMFKIGQATPIDMYNLLHVADTVTTVGNNPYNGISNESVINIGGSTAAQMRGFKNFLTFNLSGNNLTNSLAGIVGLFNVNKIAGSGTITNYINDYGLFNNTGNATITNAFGRFIDNATNTGGGSITNSTGFFIKQQTGGTNNTQLHIGNTVPSPPTGNWSIYNNSAYQTYSGVTNVQAFGTAQEFFNAAYDVTNYSKYRMYWASTSQFNISPQIGGTGAVGDLLIGNSAGAKYLKIQQTTLPSFGAVFTFDHGTTSGSNIMTTKITGNFTATGNSVYSLAITPTLNMGGAAIYSGIFESILPTSLGSGPNYFARFGTNTAANGTGTHTDKFTIDLSGNVSTQGNVSLAVGKKINIAPGSNASIGTATLVAGTVTVNTTAVSASSLIFLTVPTAGGTRGTLTYTISAGTSFTVTSSSATDTSTIAYLILN